MNNTETTINLSDGEYLVDIILEGGSGRASVTSPAVLTVEDGSATAQIEWSSANYDYMKLNEETFLPVNDTGNSVFELPVEEFDVPIPVTADTTAMSTPHEIEYTLTFDSSSVVSSGDGGPLHTAVLAAGICVCAVIAVCAFFLPRARKRKPRK